MRSAMPWPKGKPKPQSWKDVAVPAMKGKKKKRRDSVIPPWLKKDYELMRRKFNSPIAREWLNWKMFGLIEIEDDDG